MLLLPRGRVMKVAHFSLWGCRQSGLYECTKDQIKYERKLGIDSVLGLFDVENPEEGLQDDGWLSPVSWEQCKDADVFVENLRPGVADGMRLHR